MNKNVSVLVNSHDDLYDYLIVLFLSILVFVVCVFRVSNRVGLYLTGDEFALFGITAYFLGYDWSPTVTNVGYYSFGYSFLLVPLFLIANSTEALYRYSMYLNAFLASLIVPISYLICKQSMTKPFLKKNVAIVIIILFTTLSGAVIAYSSLGLSEILLTLLIYAITLCFYKLSEKKMVWFVVQAFLLGYLYAVHMRTLGVIIAALLVVFIMTVLKRVEVKHFLVFLIVLLVLLVANTLIAEHIKYHVWLGGGRDGNDFNSRVFQFSSLFTESDRFFGATRAVAGQVFYLGVASFTLIFFAVLKLFQLNVEFLKNIRITKGNTFNIIKTCESKVDKKNEKSINANIKENENINTDSEYDIINNFDFTLMFLLFAFLGTLAISAIAMNEVVRGDHFVYGRYNSPIYPVLLLYLLVGVVKGEWKFSLRNIEAIVIIMTFLLLTTWVVQHFSHNYEDRHFMDFNVVNLSWFRSLSSNISNSLYFAASISVIIGSVIMVFLQTNKRLLSYIAFFIGIFIAYISAESFYERTIRYFDDFNMEIRTLVSEIDRDIPVYFLIGEGGIFAGGVHLHNRLQFELFNRTMNYLRHYDFHTLSQKETYFFVENNQHAIDILLNHYTNRVYIGSVDNGLGRYSLYRSYGETASDTPEVTVGLKWFYRYAHNRAVLTDRGLSNSSSGFFMIGPYINLSQGAYEVDFSLSLVQVLEEHQREGFGAEEYGDFEVELGFIDVSAEMGREILIRLPITRECLQNSPQTFSLPFSLLEDTQNIEFRALAYEDTVLVIENVTLRRLGGHI